MSEGINRVILLGNLGADPEPRFTQGGSCVLNIRMATTETYFDANKEKKERVDWHNVVCFGKRAEALSKILQKGSQILVEGRLQTSSYEDKENQKRYKTEVISNNIVLVGSKPGGGKRDDAAPNTSRSPGRGNGQRPADVPPGGGRGYGGSGRAAPAPPDDYGTPGNDDDVPFVVDSIAHDLHRWGLG